MSCSTNQQEDKNQLILKSKQKQQTTTDKLGATDIYEQNLAKPTQN